MLIVAADAELTLCADLSLALQIALVADDNDRERVLVLDSKDLLLECDDLLEALPRCYTVDQQKTLARPHVLLAHRRVFFLSGGIEHVQQRYLVVDHALLPVRVCRRGVYQYCHSCDLKQGFVAFAHLLLWDHTRRRSGSE